MADGSRQPGTAARDVGQADRPPLAEAKIAVPSLRQLVVDRPRVRQVLDARGDAAVILVAAPAGYGKTTAVRAWCATLDAALAWITLDASDNDPARLWRYVATAVDRIRPGLGRSALQRLQGTALDIDDVVDDLANGIGAYGDPLVLVLDDLQTVTGPEPLASLEHAIAHLPANARLILVTRADPDLRLARLRAGGELLELRTRELAFTTDEANRLLAVGGHLRIGPEQVDLLVRRTEGWPAALVLAGLWLRTVDDPVSAVETFGGEHRFVADYLSNEVLASLDDDHRSLLQGAAVLGEFTAELCDDVLERTDSAAQLDELERANLFVQGLERGGWFRIHSLFAEYARAQLAAGDRAAEARIHGRAADWLRARRLPVEAIRHAAAAGDHDLLVDILVEHHVALISSGGSRTLLHWCRFVPDEHLVAHPDLSAAAAVAAILVGGSTADARRFLRIVERASESGPQPLQPYAEAASLLARSLSFEGGIDRALHDARRAVELSKEGFDELVTGSLVAQARALFFAGLTDEASTVASGALEHPDIHRRTPAVIHARTTLALAALERGRLAVARSQAEQAKAGAARIGSSRSWLGANAAAALGVVLAAEGNLTRAERELASAEQFFAEETANLHHAWLLLLLARVRTGRGHVREAEATLRAALEELADIPDAGRVAAQAGDVERELELALAAAGGEALLERPSEAELAVLRLLVTDLSTRQIGERLYLSPNTIRSHMRALYRKLGVHTRSEAVTRAETVGLLAKSESPG